MPGGALGRLGAWHPRLFALIICVGPLVRWFHLDALRELNGEYGSLAGLVAFWIPLGVVLGIVASMLVPHFRRKLTGWWR